MIVRFLEPILILAKEHTPGNYLLIDEEEEQVYNTRGAIEGLHLEKFREGKGTRKNGVELVQE